MNWSISRRRWLIGLLIGVLVGAVVVYLQREVLLRSLGALLIQDDPLRPADLAVMTSDTLEGGEIELADLLAQHMTRRVAALSPQDSAARRELVQRGVTPDPPGRVLSALGVRPEDIVLISAGEGGTTDGTAALASWCERENIRRVIVVTEPDHARRVKRTLARLFGKTGPEVLMHPMRFSEFRPEDWWRHRRSLRTGLVELQKLFLDYVQHPLE